MLDKKQHTLVPYLIWLPLLLILIYCLLRSVNFQIHDFANYYYGAMAIKDGWFDQNIYLADGFNFEIESRYNHNVFISYYPNSPSHSLLYYVFSFFDWKTAKLLLNLGSIGFLFLGLKTLLKTHVDSSLLLPLVSLLFIVPIKNNILFGQSYLILFGLLSIFIISLQQENWIQSKLSLAFAIFLKVSPIILLGYLICIKKIKQAVFLGLMLLAGLLISLLFIDLSTWHYYLTDVFKPSSQGILYNGFSKGAESMEVLFRLLFLSDPILNPEPFVANFNLFIAVKLIVKSILAGITFIYTINDKRDLGLKFGLWIILLLLISPSLSSYSLILLLIPFMLQWPLLIKKEKVFISILIGLICCYQTSYFDGAGMIADFGRLILLSIYFCIYILSSKSNGFTKNKTALLLSVILALALFQYIIGPKKAMTLDPYVLKEEPHIMLKDFSVIQDQIKTVYITSTIDTTIYFPSIPQTKQSRILAESEYQDYELNKHCKKAILINQNLIFYMTDQNRSPGFYTLRQKSISK